MCTLDGPVSTPGPVTSYRRLRAAGASRRDITTALETGALTRARRGIYVSAEACAEVAATASHGGALACVSAAQHLGLWVLDAGVETHVWMGRGGRSYHGDGCTCVEHWDAGRVDVFGLPSVPRILRQILHCRGVESFFVALESARRQQMLDAAGIRWLHAHIGEPGREALRFSRDDADSGLESLFRWRLRHLPVRVRTQLGFVGVGRVDILIGERLLVELDGEGNHGSVSHRHRDLTRDAQAAAWGYTTLRFDYALVIHDWPAVEAAILGALAAGHHLAPG